MAVFTAVFFWAVTEKYAPAVRIAVMLPRQLRGEDHRGADRAGQGGDEVVQAADPVVGEPGAVFVVAVDFGDFGVDVEERELVGAGQQRHLL
ncbi:hypothetical protein [Amycolatopsis sp.]|jgi:hypothetical protein|uniref:hypothetical protein n=1 Tax=Amycolatopsis sp. TaxID=37632 RepID=UPI0039C85A32